MTNESPALTPRMKQVLDGIAAGRNNEHIAADLRISRKTVEKHRAALYTAFKVDNAVSLVMSALRARAISL